MFTTISRPVDADLLRLRNEFATMPGLCLTTEQTARLLSVRKAKACALLDALVVDGLLVRSVSGIYRRARFG
jgi:hypothetical protein